MADRQRQARLVGQALQLPFPQPQAPAVAATAIGDDQQSPGAWVKAAALGTPPAANRSHRERARVVVRAYVDEAGVAPQVVDPVGIGAGHFGTGKIMSVDLVRRPRLAPLAALVLVVADQFLLLRVHGNDGLARPQGEFNGSVDMPELRVAIGVIVPLLGLAVALQTVATLPQELGDFGVAHRVVLGRQFRRQGAGALARPAQGRLRVTAGCGLDHAVQGGYQARIVGRQRVSSAALVANPARGQRRGLQFLDALGQRNARQATGAAHPRNTAITQFHRFAGGHQPAGVFVQMGPHASKVLGQLGIGAHTNVIARQGSRCKCYLFTPPYVYEYSFGLEYGLPGSWVAALGYEGSDGHKFARIVNQNFLYTNNPAFFAVYFPMDDVNSNFNA